MTRGFLPFEDVLLPAALGALPFEHVLLPVTLGFLPFEDVLLPAALGALPFEHVLLPMAQRLLPFEHVLLPAALGKLPARLGKLPLAHGLLPGERILQPQAPREGDSWTFFRRPKREQFSDRQRPLSPMHGSGRLQHAEAPTLDTYISIAAETVTKHGLVPVLEATVRSPASLDRSQARPAPGRFSLTTERLRLTVVDLDLAKVRFDLTVERFNLTMEKLSLAAVNLDLTAARFYLTVERYNLTMERLSLTEVNLNLTAVRFELTLERFKLTVEKLSLIAERSNLTMKRLSLTAAKSLLPRIKALRLAQSLQTGNRRSWSDGERSCTSAYGVSRPLEAPCSAELTGSSYSSPTVNSALIRLGPDAWGKRHFPAIVLPANCSNTASTPGPVNRFSPSSIIRIIPSGSVRKLAVKFPLAALPSAAPSTTTCCRCGSACARPADASARVRAPVTCIDR
jgi:hypothetical protein